jgi:hypothetical protein
LSRNGATNVRALVPPALNPHLTKSRLNDALRLCEMQRGAFDPRGIERKEEVKLSSWARVDEYE